MTLVLIALTWGITFVIVQRALHQISTIYFLAVRFWFAAFCMLLLFFRPLRHTHKRALWRGLRGGAAAGLFLWLGYVLQTFGLKYTSAGNSGFITGFYIVLVPLISACLYRRWPQLREAGGVFIASAGIALLAIRSLANGLHINPGDVLTFACAIAFAFHLLVLGYFSQRERFEPVALGQIVCTALLSTLFLVVEPPHASWTPDLVIAIIITGLFATALAFALQTWAQQYTTPTRTALLFSSEPVFALVTAVLFGGEAFTISAVAGGALILTGILLVELKPQRQR